MILRLPNLFSTSIRCCYWSWVFLLHLAPQALHAANIQCQAMVRDHKDRLVLQQVQIKDLEENATAYEGRFFKIVFGNSNNAIAIGDQRVVNSESPKGKDLSLSTRACTAYYHLSLARDYFVKNFQARRARNISKMVVRIQMPLRFIDSNHFMHEDFKAYNDSLTIMPSNGNKLSHVESWGTEIWFSPAKEIALSNQIQQAASYISSKEVQEQLRLGVFTSVGANVAAQYARGVQFGSVEGQLYIESLLTSLFVVTVTPFVINKIAGIFKKKFFIDTGLIPEVIYHEFAHVALSEHLEPMHNVPLVEGMANFFAAEVGQTDALLRKTRGLSKGYNLLDAEKRLVFDSWMEDVKYAHYTFTFHLLWKIKHLIDEIVLRDEDGKGPLNKADPSQSIGAKVIYGASQSGLINNSSDLQRDLTKAIEDSVRKNISPEYSTEVLLGLARLWDNIGF